MRRCLALKSSLIVRRNKIKVGAINNKPLNKSNNSSRKWQVSNKEWRNLGEVKKKWKRILGKQNKKPKLLMKPMKRTSSRKQTISTMKKSITKKNLVSKMMMTTKSLMKNSTWLQVGAVVARAVEREILTSWKSWWNLQLGLKSWPIKGKGAHQSLEKSRTRVVGITRTRSMSLLRSI